MAVKRGPGRPRGRGRPRGPGRPRGSKSKAKAYTVARRVEFAGRGNKTKYEVWDVCKGGKPQVSFGAEKEAKAHARRLNRQHAISGKLNQVMARNGARNGAQASRPAKAKARQEKPAKAKRGRPRKVRSAPPPASLATTMAFLDVLAKSPRVKSHLEAVLGLEGIPGMDDFASHDGEAQARADRFIAFLGDVTEKLAGQRKGKPRQLELIREAVVPDGVERTFIVKKGSLPPGEPGGGILLDGTVGEAEDPPPAHVDQDLEEEGVVL